MNDNRYLAPRVLQIFGLVLLGASFVFWAFTGQQSQLLVGAATVLIGTGSARGIQDVYRQAKNGE